MCGTRHGVWYDPGVATGLIISGNYWFFVFIIMKDIQPRFRATTLTQLPLSLSVTLLVFSHL